MKFNKHLFYPFYLLLTVLLCSLTLFFDACKPSATTTGYTFTGDTIKDGKNLVAINCTKCHKLVEPGMLTRDVWKYHTLPSMAKYFGIGTYSDAYFEAKPDSAKLTLKEWQAIVSYYNKVAPAALEKAAAPVPLLNDWAGFILKNPIA